MLATPLPKGVVVLFPSDPKACHAALLSGQQAASLGLYDRAGLAWRTGGIGTGNISFKVRCRLRRASNREQHGRFILSVSYDTGRWPVIGPRVFVAQKHILLLATRYSRPCPSFPSPFSPLGRPVGAFARNPAPCHPRRPFPALYALLSVQNAHPVHPCNRYRVALSPRSGVRPARSAAEGAGVTLGAFSGRSDGFAPEILISSDSDSTPIAAYEINGLAV